MTRRRNSSGYLGLAMVSVAQRLASLVMPLAESLVLANFILGVLGGF